MTTIGINYLRIKNVKKNCQFLRDLLDMWNDTLFFRAIVMKKTESSQGIIS